VAVALALILALFMGAIPLGLAGLRPSRRAGLGALVIWLTLAMGAGLGITSWTYWAWVAVAPDKAWLLWTVEAALGLVGAATCARSMSVRSQAVAPEVPGLRQAPESRLGNALLGLGVLAALLLVGLAVVGWQLRYPYGNIDAYSQWGLKARFLYPPSEHWKDLFFDELQTHPDYPLLVPLSVARLWHAQGAAAPVLGGVVSALFLLLTGGLLYGILSVCAGFGQACRGLLALAACSLVVNGGWYQYADLPLAFYLLAGSVLIIMREGEDAGTHPGAGAAGAQRRLRLLALAGFMFGLGAWTKNEGAALLACALVALFGVELWRSGLRQALASAAVVALGAVPGVCALMIEHRVGQTRNDIMGSATWGVLLGRLTEWSRYAVIFREGVRVIIEDWRICLVIPAVALYALAAPKRWDMLRGAAAPMVAGMCLLGAVAYVLVYAISPHDLVWHVGTSASRLFLHFWPTVVLVVLVVTGDWRSDEVGERQSHAATKGGMICGRARCAGSSMDPAFGGPQPGPGIV
jgi:hypothetical protein